MLLYKNFKFSYIHTTLHSKTIITHCTRFSSDVEKYRLGRKPNVIAKEQKITVTELVITELYETAKQVQIKRIGF